MSRTYKTEPYRVKARKLNAGNAHPWHHHHSNHPTYVDAVDRNGNIIYETGVEIVKYVNYASYVRAVEERGEVPRAQNHIPGKPREHHHTSHEETVWQQTTKTDLHNHGHYFNGRYHLYGDTHSYIHERVPYHRPVKVRGSHEMECSINEIPGPENGWGDTLPCTYHGRTLWRVVFTPDRIARKISSNKRNRRLSKHELRELTKAVNDGADPDDEGYTAHVVRKRNDWLG